MILVSAFMWYKSPSVEIREGKKSHLQIVSSFVSGTAPQLPSEQVFIYSCRQSHVFMRINPKLAHRLAGTDCIFYHMRNSWRVYPQKIERKQDERRRNGWVSFWVSARSVSLTLFWFVFSRIYKRVLWIICVQWRVLLHGRSERTYGAIIWDRK